jgi:hypothetical protein
LRINVPVKLLRSDDRDCGPGRLGPRVVALVVGFVVLWASVFAGLWRERLALYLLDRRFRRGRGYSWQIGTQTGSLDGIETTALSTELRQAGRGGTYTEFIVELRFRQPLEAVKIEGFRTEGDARELIALLSRTLHVPFIDRTVEPTRQVDWNDVAKPLVGRGFEKHRGISAIEAIPPPPPAGGIELSRAAVQPIITLPCRDSASVLCCCSLLPRFSDGLDT